MPPNWTEEDEDRLGEKEKEREGARERQRRESTMGPIMPRCSMWEP